MAGIFDILTGGIEALSGSRQTKKANKQISSLEQNSPNYMRPGEAKQLLEMAKTNANATQLPGQGQMEQNIQQGTQNSISNIKNLTESPTSSLGALADVNRMEIGAFNNLAMQATNYYQSNQDRLANALRENAQYSDQEFEYNRNAPWMRAYGNAINNFQSGRNLMTQGMGGMKQGLSDFTDPSPVVNYLAGGGFNKMNSTQPQQQQTPNYNYNNPVYTSPYNQALPNNPYQQQYA
jgi:hypothetical protein